MRMQRTGIYLLGLMLLLATSTALARSEPNASAKLGNQDSARLSTNDDSVLENAEDMIEQGRRT
ncbi:MAG TPA: hypothetical protein VFU22_19965, partial [Roseiflexaceae bacterium]|nr:hypothetical protein [Roseiflexaceae bacterium]